MAAAAEPELLKASAAKEGPHQPRVLPTLQFHHSLKKTLLCRATGNTVHTLDWRSRNCGGCGHSSHVGRSSGGRGSWLLISHGHNSHQCPGCRHRSNDAAYIQGTHAVTSGGSGENHKLAVSSANHPCGYRSASETERVFDNSQGDSPQEAGQNCRSALFRGTRSGIPGKSGTRGVAVSFQATVRIHFYGR